MQASVPPSSDDRMNFPFRPDEHQAAPATVKRTSTPGPVDVSYSALANLRPRGQKQLLDLFNNSWETGQVASVWKNGRSIRTLKPGKSATVFPPLSSFEILELRHRHITVSAAKSNPVVSSDSATMATIATQTAGIQPAPALTKSRPLRDFCYYCGIPGHVQRNCRRRRQEQAPSDHFTSLHWAPRRTFHSRPELRSPSPGLDERPQPNTSRPTTRRSPSPRGRSLSPMIPAHNGDPRRSGGNW
ncbi:hypothetical protein HPB47_001337 [Ixodes persulcatus]|uniref:Uncharacterized protein n=1 Tax=Ixodes persulcatus TaxID=34615 RepID=A0AC60PPN4_IXOPE|nr:hypothetical protein HPB47_001337 [Ixodes persulcatus]